MAEVDKLPAGEPVRYLSAENLDHDDFGDAFTHYPGEIVWDAKTQMGPWATMTEKSFNQHAHRVVRENGAGTGRGQKYVRTDFGHLIKKEG